ncbi:MAG TPA: pyridoxal-phosphate dependent enzyme [Kofleriaceae bacterium]|nr:pyridoxal-phosphate dependent enzyme [Kofleriaceae bacterium]
MTQLSPPPEILVLGDPRLRERCTAVEQVDRGELARLAAGLAEARARLGFGRAIAAPQIGIPRRIVMVNLGAGPFPVINPEITWRSDELFELWDDCLSVPDRLIRVRRHRSISLAFRDEQLRPRIWRELPPELAELLQHEIDHLDGVLMVDRAIDEAASRPIGERGALVDAARRGHRLSLDRIAEAARTIDPVFLRTPQYVCEPLAELAGCRLTIKVETANPIRSFKGRGADFTVATRVARGDRASVACASAGNFGQGMAYACRARGLPITVFAAHGANPLKLARMAALGAEVRIAGADLEEAKQIARAWAAEHGAQFVEDGEDPQVSEGAGSIAVELLGSGEAFDAVVVPVGDGALINGIARWVKAASPSTRVIGVCSSGAPAMAEAWRGRLRGLPPPEPRMPATIADGIAVRRPIAASLDDMRDTVDGFVEVDDAALIAAMRALHGHAGLVGEPAGVAGLAAVLAGRAALDGQRVATVICGGNATRQHLIEYEILGAAERPA